MGEWQVHDSNQAINRSAKGQKHKPQKIAFIKSQENEVRWNSVWQWNSGESHVQSYRQLSILRHTLLVTVSRQMLFHLTSSPLYHLQLTHKDVNCKQTSAGHFFCASSALLNFRSIKFFFWQMRKDCLELQSINSSTVSPHSEAFSEKLFPFFFLLFVFVLVNFSPSHLASKITISWSTVSDHGKIVSVVREFSFIPL